MLVSVCSGGPHPVEGTAGVQLGVRGGDQAFQAPPERRRVSRLPERAGPAEPPRGAAAAHLPRGGGAFPAQGGVHMFKISCPK